MSPTTLGLTILGTVATSAGIGIAVTSLSNTKIEPSLLKEKFRKLTEKIEGLVSSQDDPSYKEAADKKKKLEAKIKELTNLSDPIPTFKNPNNDWENHKKSWEIWKEMDEIFKLLEKVKKIEIKNTLS